MLPRTDLIRLQRALYDRLKKRSRTYLGGLSEPLKRYFQTYQRDFRSFEGLSSKTELIQELKKADVVFCGDYHSLPQAQRTVIRLLREAVKDASFQKRHLYIGLEMIPASKNALVKKYLDGKLSQSAFLKAVSFERWGFHWENYEPLFAFARERGIRIVGLSAGVKGSLEKRDEFAAKRLSDLIKADEKAWIIALMGDLHIAEAHLPRRFREIFPGNPPSSLILHQNNESLYWKLVEGGMEQFAEVVKLRAGIYCLMNTLPWIKLKNHLRWAESQGASSRQVAEAEELEDTDPAEEVSELIRNLSGFLELSEIVDNIDSFTIHTPADLDFFTRWERSGTYTAREMKVLSRGLFEFESQYFFKTRSLFITGLRLNQLASLAAIHLYAELSGYRGVFERPDRDFYAFVWVEALGFLGSKVINPHRRCHGISDLEKEVAQKKRKSSDLEAFRLALKHFRLERQSRPGQLIPTGPIPDEKVVLFYKVAKILGRVLGEAIYGEVLRNRISRQEVRALFQAPASTAEARYFDWIHRLDQFGARDFERDW